MTISKKDIEEHDKFVYNMTNDQIRELTKRTSIMLSEWVTKEEIGSEEHKFIADLAVPVGVYVLTNDDNIVGETLSDLVMSTAFAAYNYGRAQLREELARDNG
jgi:hypothetical protein